MHLTLDLDFKCSVAERTAPFGLPPRHQPDKARTMRVRAEPTQWNQSAGAGARVKFCRNLMVRLFMREEGSQRDLRIGPAAYTYAGLGPGERRATIRGDDQSGFDAMAFLRCRADPIGLKDKITQHGFVKAEIGGLSRDFGKSFDQHIILDIFTESGKTYLTGGEGDRGNGKPRTRVIDHADFFERGALRGKPRPEAQRPVET